MATVGVRLDRALSGGMFAVQIDIGDYSSDNPAIEDLVALTPVASAPSQCPFPLSTGGGFYSTFNGTFVVAPAPALPTSKDQCKRGGWRNFPQFQNQGQCVMFVVRSCGQRGRFEPEPENCPVRLPNR